MSKSIYNYSDLNKSSLKKLSAIVEVMRSHISCARGERSKFNNFSLPLVLSSNEDKKSSFNFSDFETLFGTVAVYIQDVYNHYPIYALNEREFNELKVDGEDIAKGKYYTVSIYEDAATFKEWFPLLPCDDNFKYSVIPENMQKRNGKTEKQKTADNKAVAEAKEAVVAEIKADNEKLKAENKKLVAKNEKLSSEKLEKNFHDDSNEKIADAIEKIILHDLPIPSDYDFSNFEVHLFELLSCNYDVSKIKW